MKRYTLIDNEKNTTHNYSNFEWNLAWKLAFILGVMTGYLIHNI